MAALPNWTPWLEVFLLAFVLASLISSLTHWVARIDSVIIGWFRRFFVLYAMLFSPWELIRNEPSSIVLYLGVLLCVSTVQTLLERSPSGELSSRFLFTRSFLTYHSNTLLLVVTSNLLFGVLQTHSGGPSPWRMDLSGMDYGLLTGWLFAPLSISFYGLLLPSLPMRPGIDRPLRDNELTVELR